MDSRKLNPIGKFLCWIFYLLYFGNLSIGDELYIMQMISAKLNEFSKCARPKWKTNLYFKQMHLAHLYYAASYLLHCSQQLSQQTLNKRMLQYFKCTGIWFETIDFQLKNHFFNDDDDGGGWFWVDCDFNAEYCMYVHCTVDCIKWDFFLANEEIFYFLLQKNIFIHSMWYITRIVLHSSMKMLFVPSFDFSWVALEMCFQPEIRFNFWKMNEACHE